MGTPRHQLQPLDNEQLEALHHILCLMGQEDVLDASLHSVHDDLASLIAVHNQGVAVRNRIRKAQWN